MKLTEWCSRTLTGNLPMLFSLIISLFCVMVFIFINKIPFFNFLQISAVLLTHFTNKSFFKIQGYDNISFNHPVSWAHGRAAVVKRFKIKYYQINPISLPQFQVVGVLVNCGNLELAICWIYCPPKHLIFVDYKNLIFVCGNKFLLRGDFNAKPPWCASRLTNRKGKKLYICLQNWIFLNWTPQSTILIYWYMREFYTLLQLSTTNHKTPNRDLLI